MEVTTGFLEKYNTQGPRYTSYPPATSFKTGMAANGFINAVKESNRSKPVNISIYIHIPFCTQRCFFCGCNTTLFESDEKISRYIHCLKKEIETVAEHIEKNRLVTQVHWGGGTPNSINLHHVQDVMGLLRERFTFADYCEVAMECNPAYLGFKDIDQLSVTGFNRLSLGIQDFHENVLAAINRRPPLNDIGATIKYLKEKGFEGVNIDLVYGLPLQTKESFSENILKAVKTDADRVVTFSYAHIPWFNPEQNKISASSLPGAGEKLAMLVDAFNTFTANGYINIGMDHFAKPGDELSMAKASHSLHRNFQGYCTKKTTGQVYAFGSSAISQLSNCYAQNIKLLDKYMSSIESTGLALERGYFLSDDEKLIGDIINEIMCNGYVNFESMAEKHITTVQHIFKITRFEQSKLDMFIADNLLSFDGNTLNVSPGGMLIVRNIAMVFDPTVTISTNRHSQTI
ncbi:MAG: oxygen-independent coproporphyrinogen III oxidase [Bacteroidales bacterium]|nr:oxygen-independent coproporphyrinogen III oxidase [Bacteroidales bacterium]